MADETLTPNADSKDEWPGIYPSVCPRCYALLGAFEMTAHILERAQFLNKRWVFYPCMTDHEKVGFLEWYIRTKEEIKQ